MAHILGIVNAKGGVGKTTTASNLCAFLSANKKRVLLVDLDPQANATAGLGIHVHDDRLNLYHSLIDGHDVRAIITKSSLVGFDILPSAQDLAGATVELVSVSEREFRLKNALEKVRNDYDFIIIDNPPSVGLLTVNGLAAADSLIIPVQCEYFALEGLTQLLKTIDLVRASLNPQLKIMGVLLTMYDRRNTLDRQVVEEVKKNFPGYVFETLIPRSVSLAEAPSFGKTIMEFNENSHGARAYRKLSEEVEKLAAPMSQ